ncbi:carboxynorspermidine decarboxylase [Clostridia bacterium]|nr:carboxynorspermidine decarboxylase [Clostridia bacterium]
MQEILNTPVYIIDEAKLISNLEILRDVELRSGVKILLAQKAFSCYYFYPLIAKYLSGATASGLYEARLAKEHFGKSNHIFSPAYKESEIDEILRITDHIVFNSVSQYEKYKHRFVQDCRTSAGLRVNPEVSTQKNSIYDPCAEFSRFGVTADCLEQNEHILSENIIHGLHFHTLCEQNFDALKLTADVFVSRFGKYFKFLRWVNFGGGHHITKPGYNREELINFLKNFREEYGLDVYLEPGEAVALDAGYLEAEVLEIVRNGRDIAILDTSAACHMPDVLEMPYTPEVVGAKIYDGECEPNIYRLAGNTCLAGDIIGDYLFTKELHPGDRIVFRDMAIYSMVKNNTFNGTPLPGIAVRHTDGSLEMIKVFNYSDFKRRV